MAADQPAKPRITPFHFKRAKERGDLIAMVTAYDAPSARLALDRTLAFFNEHVRAA